MTQFTIHHLENSRSHRVLWLFEELGLPYELVEYRRHPKTMRAPEALRAVHPLGRAPAVVVEEAGQPPMTLVESGAILEELVERYGDGRLRPEPDTEAFRRYRFYLHYAEGSMMPPLLVKLVLGRVRSAPLPFFIRPVARGIADKVDATFTDPEILHHLRFLDGELVDRAFLCGQELTAADVQLSFPLEAAAARADLSAYPNLAAYLERLRSLPSYQRAIARGGSLQLG